MLQLKRKKVKNMAGIWIKSDGKKKKMKIKIGKQFEKEKGLAVWKECILLSSVLRFAPYNLFSVRRLSCRLL